MRVAGLKLLKDKFCLFKKIKVLGHVIAEGKVYIGPVKLI